MIEKHVLSYNGEKYKWERTDDGFLLKDALSILTLSQMKYDSHKIRFNPSNKIIHETLTSITTSIHCNFLGFLTIFHISMNKIIKEYE